MHTTDISVPVVTEPVRRPTRWRRGGLVAAGFLTCALPVMFTVNITRMLVTGELAEHRFHQLTCQGLLLFALWLGGLVPLLRAGWSGRRPSSAAGLLHLVFMAAGVVTAAAAPGGGAPRSSGWSSSSARCCGSPCRSGRGCACRCGSTRC